MAKPNWTPKLSEVLGHETVEVTLHSDRTGNDYQADIIEKLAVLSTGNVEMLEDGYYRYSVVDTTENLEYELRVQKKIAVKFGTQAGFLPSLARVNCSDAVIMLGGAANSGDERRFMMSGYADLPKRNYGKGQGLAVVVGSGRKWSVPPIFLKRLGLTGFSECFLAVLP